MILFLFYDVFICESLFIAAKINAKVVGAVDINPHANIVYKHNFKETQNIQKTIEVNEFFSYSVNKKICLFKGNKN